MFRFSRIKSTLQAALVGYQIKHRTWRDLRACEHRFTFKSVDAVRDINYEVFEVQEGGIFQPKDVSFCLRNLNTQAYKIYHDVEGLMCDLLVIWKRQQKPKTVLCGGFLVSSTAPSS